MNAEARIAELEEEVAAYRSALGLSDPEASEALRLKMALDLTPGQSRMLVKLWSASGLPVSHDRLLHACSPNPFDIEPQVIKVHISRLRARLGESTIETIWGHGYRLTPEGMAKVRSALGEQAAA